MIISLYIINWLVFITETKYVFTARYPRFGTHDKLPSVIRLSYADHKTHNIPCRHDLCLIPFCKADIL